MERKIMNVFKMIILFKAIYRFNAIPFQRTRTINFLNLYAGTSLMVQWLRLHAPNAGGLVSIPGQGNRSHMPQLRVRMPNS